MPTKVYTLPGGREIGPGAAFEIPGMGKFPANWLEKASPQDLASKSITVRDVPDPKPPDPPTRTWAMVQGEARAALALNVTPVLIRCMITQALFPDEWGAYAKALYAITDTPSGDAKTSLPPAPAIPNWT